jgi:glycosyltransferase involved in cell wall biosynthesis
MPSYLRRVIITMEKLAARCSHRVLFQNREDIEIALRLKICRPEQVRFLGNGIDLEQFDRSRLDAAEIAARKKELGIPADAPVVGFVGRLAMERKGLKHLLLAGRELVKKNPNIRIVLVGGEDKGKADAVTPEVAKEYGLSENTIFAGNVSYERMPLMYSAMDLLVLPSLFEGLPRALMEAAAMGIPAVASDVKGNREAIIDGVKGFLEPLGNNGELVSRIDTLLSDRTLAATMGEQARALAVREFDEKHVFDKVLSEYEATLSRVGDSRVNVEQSKDQVFESLSELPKVHE